jgi:hypothetical protein
MAERNHQSSSIIDEEKSLIFNLVTALISESQYKENRDFVRFFKVVPKDE